MKKAFVLVVVVAATFATAQTKTAAAKPVAKWSAPKLSDDYAKAAIEYIIALQNFELNATTQSIMRAEARVESAKEDMEAAETRFGCDAKTADVLCPEHFASIELMLLGTTHTLVVHTYHLSFTTEAKSEMDKSDACLSAWKGALQKREPARCD